MSKYSNKICLLILCVPLVFLLVPIHAKNTSGKNKELFGRNIEDDDVRDAIHVACKLDCPHSEYNCNLALAPYLLQEHYNQLQGPLSCKCDQRCPLPLALVCAANAEASACLEHCLNPQDVDCKQCLKQIDPKCCPCFAYGVGIVHNKHSGKVVCDLCPHEEDPCEKHSGNCGGHHDCGGASGSCNKDQQNLMNQRSHGREKHRNQNNQRRNDDD